ncbi:unnamed protein product [Pleuronectes platessa]|uniref:Uncharacterized protein n=1 Tax=Pleuronectes platessa TaxID=8262 RepID=A0A9N7Z703_PLEPL|nr:unnamed protein product [Pleuronectes platessa]
MGKTTMELPAYCLEDDCSTPCAAAAPTISSRLKVGRSSLDAMYRWSPPRTEADRDSGGRAGRPLKERSVVYHHMDMDIQLPRLTQLGSPKWFMLIGCLGRITLESGSQSFASITSQEGGGASGDKLIQK